MPTPTGRRREIIEAATKLIHERGMHELTLKNLASRIGVSEPALYRHFASKADILKGVLDLFEDEIQAVILPDTKGPTGPERRVHADIPLGRFVSGLAAALEHRPELTTLLFTEEVFLSEPTLAERMHNLMTKTRDRVSTIIDSGIHAGEYRPDIDPVSVATALIGGIRLLGTMRRFGSSTMDLSHSIDTLWRTVRTSLAIPGSTLPEERLPETVVWGTTSIIDKESRIS